MMNFRENKFFKIVLGIIKFIIYILVIAIVFIIVLQRISGNALTFGGIRIFNIYSGSMEPNYEKGDIIIVKETDPNKIKVGQDIVYHGTKGQVEGKIVTHKVIKIEETKNGRVFHTKGINSMAEDPTVNEKQIYGIVVYKMIIISFINKLMYNIYVFYALIIIPTGIIIFLEIKDVRNKLREED